MKLRALVVVALVLGVGVAVVSRLRRPGPSASSGPVTDLRVRSDSRPGDEGNKWYLELSFDYTAEADFAEDERLVVRAACDSGPHRLVEMGVGVSRPSRRRAMSSTAPLRRGTTKLEDHPFITRPLPAEPTRCDLTLVKLRGYGSPTSEEVARFCATRDDLVPEACPPHAHDAAAAGGAGMTAELVHAGVDEGSELFPGDALLLRYVITAHRDVEAGSSAVQSVQCDGRFDETWHQDAQYLRAGESLHAGQLMLRGRIDPRTARCEIRFRADRLHAPAPAEIARFCYHAGKVSPGGCG